MKPIIPDAALTQHLVVLGKTGKGKSSVLRLLVESLLDQGKPVCIVDPKGDWYGLRSSADGRGIGYPVVIFGGEHADVPLNVHAAASVAELVATGNRPCIIDLGGWMVGERTRFFIAFAAALFKHTRGPRHLVIDEVHNFAPQGKVIDPDAGKMLHWANRLASEGRGRGITILSASQRPQKVHKDFLTSSETLIAMGVIHPLDRGAIKDWIDGCPDPAKGKEVLATLATLPRGEGWVWSPEIGFGPERVKFPKYVTYDSFKAPTGEATARLKGWAEVDLAEVRDRLGAAVKEAEANDPALLRKEIAQLKRDAAAKGKPDVVDRSAELDAAHHDLRIARTQLDSFGGVITKLQNKLIAVRAALGDVDVSAAAGVQLARDSIAMATHKPVQRTPPSPRPVHPPAPKVHNGDAPSIPVGERLILEACIQFPNGLRREQLTVLTGYKRSTRDAYIQRLREKGYVEAEGDRVKATDEGGGALPDARPLPTGEALQDYWRNRLPEGERKILDVLIEDYPSAVSREDVTTRTGYIRSTRDAYVQRMRAKQLVTEPSRGMVRASEVLFE